MNGSKSTNYNPQTWPFAPMKLTFCWLNLFPETSAKMIDIWSRFRVAWSSRLSSAKIWRTFAYVEGQQNINVYDVRQPFMSCVLPKFRILKMSQNISPWVRLEFVTSATLPPLPAVVLSRGWTWAWVTQEHKLRNSKYKSNKAGAGRHVAFKDVDKRLYEEFQELRGKGVKVKEWWFRIRCKQLMAELHPGVEFKMSNHWFDRFKSRYDISLLRPTKLHTNSLKHCVPLFNNFTDISVERQQLKQLSWRVSKKAL